MNGVNGPTYKKSNYLNIVVFVLNVCFKIEHFLWILDFFFFSDIFSSILIFILRGKYN